MYISCNGCHYGQFGRKPKIKKEKNNQTKQFTNKYLVLNSLKQNPNSTSREITKISNIVANSVLYIARRDGLVAEVGKSPEKYKDEWILNITDKGLEYLENCNKNI
jgi:hypothetical protein